MNKEVTKKSSGVLGGLILLVIGISMLWTNEGRAVKTQSAINEAKKVYVDVKSDKVDSKNEGKLVATKGKVTVSEDTILKDSKYGISVNAIKMKRTVEMYQWEETCETDDNDKRKCTYEKVWDDDLIDSEDFEQENHDNPTTFPVESEVFAADEVKLGAFVLPEELVNKISYNKKKDSEELQAEYNNSNEELKVSDKYLTNVKEDNAEIGDIRISYSYLTPKTVSVMAVQTDNTFEAFTSKRGKDIYTIVEGNKTGIQILESMTSANTKAKWFFRILGILITIGAFNSMFNFINTLAGKVPVLGKIISGTTSVISGMLGVSVSLIVIAIAWFRFRPVLSIVLIALAVALVIFLKFFKKEEQPKEK